LADERLAAALADAELGVAEVTRSPYPRFIAHYNWIIERGLTKEAR